MEKKSLRPPDIKVPGSRGKQSIKRLEENEINDKEIGRK